MNRDRLSAQLKFDEGVRSYAYTDSEGYLTIGVGRLIDRAKGGKLSDEEIDFLLDNDIDKFTEQARTFGWYLDLNDVRQEVVVNMIFNLGLGIRVGGTDENPRYNGFKGFRDAIKAIERHDWTDAAREMLDSKWAGQVGQRAVRLSEAMRTGQWV